LGFNTVVLLLNDHFTSVRESPKTLTWALTHPPNSTVEDMDQWWKTLHHVADGYKERHISRSALKVLPTFHMGYKHVLVVGGNRIEPVEVTVGRGEVAIDLPEWWRTLS